MDFQFKIPERELWINKITTELKENSDRINYKNEIEEIEFDISAVANNSYSSVDQRSFNEWKNCFKIDVQDEVLANQACLKALMLGADSLFLVIHGSKTHWFKLFHGIQFEYIYTRIIISNGDERSSLDKFLKDNGISNVDIFIDPITDVTHEIKLRNFLLNGFELQQIGANTWQEIGILLSSFHELIIKDLIDSKFNFHLGIGSNYFVEIAKIRAIKWLCKHLCNLYQINLEINFSGEVGFMNKSLNDPHTNLLRQTTEAMSAISGGISEITIRAYDDLSVKGSTDFSRRMALNVSNLLKEESYFDFVKDPLKGSNILEFLTEQIISKAWTYFKQLEQFESINDLDKIEFIRKSISETRKRRLENFEKKKMELIGINCFMNPQNEPNSWLNNETYLEMSYFIFETCQ